MKLARIAQAIGCPVDTTAGELDIVRIATPESADERSVVFLSSPRYLDPVRACRAAAVIAKPGTDVGTKVLLACADPYAGYARTALLFEDRSPLFGGGVHPTAVIDPSARLGEGVSVGPGSVVGPRCALGARCVVAARAVLEDGATLGDDCRVDSGAIIRRDVRIGNRVIIQSGAIIGSEGFGNAMTAEGWIRIPCFGSVTIEDDVEIGAGACIDRGNFDDTIVRRGARIDNLVHLAHNVEVGQHSAIAAQTGISGSTRVGNRVLIGGQAGFVGHITIGDGAFVGAQSGVSKSIEPGEKVSGYPARDLMTMRRIDAALSRLPEALKELKELRKMLESRA